MIKNKKKPAGISNRNWFNVFEDISKVNSCSIHRAFFFLFFTMGIFSLVFKKKQNFSLQNNNNNAPLAHLRVFVLFCTSIFWFGFFLILAKDVVNCLMPKYCALASLPQPKILNFPFFFPSPVVCFFSFSGNEEKINIEMGARCCTSLAREFLGGNQMERNCTNTCATTLTAILIALENLIKVSVGRCLGNQHEWRRFFFVF